jgi:hypothetical protein
VYERHSYTGLLAKVLGSSSQVNSSWPSVASLDPFDFGSFDASVGRMMRRRRESAPLGRGG